MDTALEDESGGIGLFAKSKSAEID